MGLYRDEGIVLRTYKLGESDRIVVVLTAGRGKVRAVAKGVRKTKSRFGARLEPLSNVALLLHEGRQLDVVSQAETLEHHRATREDLDRMAEALALLEAVDQVAQEGEPNPALYRMLQGALRTLDDRPSPLLVAAFYWKLLALEGVAPVLDRCVSCGAADLAELVSLDLAEGGVLCRACRRGPAVAPGALELIRRILGGDLAGVLAEPRRAETAVVAALATTALEVHLERRLRVARLFERA